MNSRSSLRQVCDFGFLNSVKRLSLLVHDHLMWRSPCYFQGALSQRRSNYQGNQFPFANAAARRSVATPYHGMAVHRDRMVNQKRSRCQLCIRVFILNFNVDKLSFEIFSFLSDYVTFILLQVNPVL